MQRKKEIPTNPRFDFVTKKAYDLLFELGIKSFPIKAEQVLEELSDFIECQPWSKAKKIMNAKDPFNLHQTKADAKSMKRRDSNLYLIVYDDRSGYSPERINWSILHEIGHILLGHLDEFDVTALDRGGLTKEAYGVLEVETNWFVSELLMPTPIVRQFDRMDVDEISILFGVSEEAAEKKYKRAYEKGYMYTKYDELLLRHFYHFLTTDLLATLYRQIYAFYGFPVKVKYAKICRKCPSCYSFVADEKAVRCYHCGEELELKTKYRLPFSQVEEMTKLAKTKGYAHPRIPYRAVNQGTANEVERVLFCPNCLNNEIEEDSKYCSICGFPTYNECIEEHLPLDFNASYCSNCGSPSTIHEMYEKMEARLKLIQEWSTLPSDDWLIYDHWKYVRMRVNFHAQTDIATLPAALFYTCAFIDDDNNIIIYVDSENAANEIRRNSEFILQTVCRYDVIKPTQISVYVR